MTRHLLMFACVGVFWTAPAQAQAPDPIKIGVDSLFDEVEQDKVPTLLRQFKDLVRDMTGLNSTVNMDGDAFSSAQALKAGKLHLGVFQGYEFAWVKEKHPQLKPLMIAVYYDRNLRANLVVPKTYTGDSIAGLKGKDIAMPLSSGGHVRLFLDRLVQEAGKTTSKMFFNKLPRPDNAEASLDAVADGDVQAAVVDNVSLETYKSVKAGPFRRLRVLKQSEVFPPGTVAYYEGKLDSDTLHRFTTGMLKANKDEKAKELMSNFKITAFEPVPADYERTLVSTRKAYPPPQASGAPAGKSGRGN